MNLLSLLLIKIWVLLLQTLSNIKMLCWTTSLLVVVFIAFLEIDLTSLKSSLTNMLIKLLKIGTWWYLVSTSYLQITLIFLILIPLALKNSLKSTVFGNYTKLLSKLDRLCLILIGIQPMPANTLLTNGNLLLMLSRGSFLIHLNLLKNMSQFFLFGFPQLTLHPSMLTLCTPQFSSTQLDFGAVSLLR
jgi:hypothetical protein